ncbi:cytochrome P450 [Micromonospora rifamycinica]|uniref:cytochrome P450 n=1 Tax=Micromonospora rifamycinica TaxID=291594 RepID=UPI00342C45C2
MTEPTADPAFPMARSCPFHPPEEYAELRAERPITRVILPDGSKAWLLTSHEYVRRFLADPHTSVHRADPAYPALVPRPPVPVSNMQTRGFLTWMDPPEHTVHRRMVVSEFTVKRVHGLQPRVQEITDRCIDAMLAGDRPVDLVQALSLPVPLQVICELLGVPYERREMFDKCTRLMLNRNSTAADRIGARREVRQYLGELVTEKDANPEDDLLSRLVVKYRDAGIFDHELLTGLAAALLIAGHETTANMISLGVVGLLENPEQLAALKADHRLAGPAAEELLRYWSIGEFSTSRIATADIEIGGQLIRAGDGVIALNSAANHDDRVFASPERLDIRRDARSQMAFGHGIHQCLGQNLARLELEIVYTTLFSRIEGLRLTVPADELPFKADASFYGIYEVPVSW